MVADGYANVYTVPPNVVHEGDFRDASREAREGHRGLWSAYCDDPIEEGPDDAQEVQALVGGGSGVGAIIIADIDYDTAGGDVEPNDSEYVLLRNSSDGDVDVGGWTLTDLKDHRITIPSGYAIAADSELRVHTGPGENTDTSYHHGAGQAIWNNGGGDTATLRDGNGEIVAEYSYES